MVILRNLFVIVLHSYKLIGDKGMYHFAGVKAKVIYSYHAQNDDELTLSEGQTLIVTDQKLEDPGWWRGELNGKTGVFPDNFVELIPEDEPTQLPPGVRFYTVIHMSRDVCAVFYVCIMKERLLTDCFTCTRQWL